MHRLGTIIIHKNFLKNSLEDALSFRVFFDISFIVNKIVFDVGLNLIFAFRELQRRFELIKGPD